MSIYKHSEYNERYIVILAPHMAQDCGLHNNMLAVMIYDIDTDDCKCTIWPRPKNLGVMFYQKLARMNAELKGVAKVFDASYVWEKMI